MNKLVPCITFLVGTAIGATATYFTVKKKFQHEADTEIEAMRQFYIEKLNELTLDEETAKTINEYKVRVEEYSNESTEKEDGKPDVNYQHVDYHKPEVLKEINSKKSYIISEDEFGDQEDYELIVLRYFADGNIIDDSTDDLITDVEDEIGYDNLSKFEELPEDAQEVIYVRNDYSQIDYQIIKDHGQLMDYFPTVDEIDDYEE